jgi:hypothetical protein
MGAPCVREAVPTPPRSPRGYDTTTVSTGLRHHHGCTPKCFVTSPAHQLQHFEGARATTAPPSPRCWGATTLGTRQAHVFLVSNKNKIRHRENKMIGINLPLIKMHSSLAEVEVWCQLVQCAERGPEKILRFGAGTEVGNLGTQRLEGDNKDQGEESVRHAIGVAKLRMRT